MPVKGTNSHTFAQKFLCVLEMHRCNSWILDPYADVAPEESLVSVSGFFSRLFWSQVSSTKV